MKIAMMLLCLLIAAGCNDRRRAEANTATTAPSGINTIRDLETLRQIPYMYVTKSRDVAFISNETAAKLDADFNSHFFRPWDVAALDSSKEEILKPFATFAANPGFGENMQLHSARWYEDLSRISMAMVPRRAITIHNTDLRILPTDRPRFDSFEKAGGGWPFDTLQESALWAATPLLIGAEAADGQWLWAQCGFASGWVKARDLAFVDESFVRTWRIRPLLAIGVDGIGINDANGIFRFTAHVGSLLPQDGNDILIPIADEGRQARIAKGPRPETRLVGRKPWDLTEDSISAVANAFIWNRPDRLGQPYGWGGMYEQRDCSSTLRDLFTPFGVWMPRNSGAQAKAGEWIPFEKLTGEQKEKLILEKALPWRTLIHYPGHIMLYLGQRNGRAIILHNFWGLATRDAAGKEGRYVIGRCVITTLQPGIERTDLMPGKGDVRERIDGMTILKLDAPSDEKK